MTKLQNKSQQLQLRLLADVSRRTHDVTVREKQGTVTSSKAAIGAPASENDMSVYRQISSNYFRSLQKVG